MLRCRLLERTLDFYTRILGLSEERRIAQLGLVQLRAGRSMIDLVPAEHPRVEDGANVDHICLGIEARDLAAVAAELRQSGVKCWASLPSATERAGWDCRFTCAIQKETSSSSSRCRRRRSAQFGAPLFLTAETLES